MQIFKQLSRAFWASKQIAHHEQGPLVADELQRTGYRTSIDLTSSHNQPLRTKIRAVEFSDNILFRLFEMNDAKWKPATQNTSNPKGGTSGCCLVS
jgi:hypothetical protein